MEFLPGTGGNVTAVTLENQFYTIVAQIQAIEKDNVKNPNEANIVTSTLDQDDFAFSGTCNIYAYHSWVNGKSEITYPDPYQDAGWVEGTSGDGNATNYNHALAQRVLMLINAERNAVNNPAAIGLKFTDVNWERLNADTNSPVLHNCLLNVTFELDIESVSNSDGNTFKAKEYLQG